MSDHRYQLKFDGGHQQRYFADRGSLLACVLRVSKQTPYPQFEIWQEAPPATLTGGRPAGRRYELVEVLDARDGDLRRRILDELHALNADPQPPTSPAPQQEGGGARREPTHDQQP